MQLANISGGPPVVEEGEATVLGFLLTAFRLASSQVGVTLKFEIWYMCLRFLRVRVSYTRYLVR